MSIAHRLFCIVRFWAITTVVTVVASEAVLWLVHPLPREGSARSIRRTDIPGLKPEIIFEKYYGLRGRSWSQQSSLAKSRGSICVLVVGASTTECSAQESTDAWWGVLEEKLSEHPAIAGTYVQVLAFGQSGLQVRQIANWLEVALPQLEPDLLVTMVGINELTWPERDDSQLPASYRVSGFLRRVSQVYRHGSDAAFRLKTLRDVHRGRAISWSTAKELKEATRRFQELPFRDPVVRDPDPLIRFKSDMQTLLNVSQNCDTPVLVLGQPVLWQEEMTDAEYSSLWFSPHEGKTAFRPSGAWLHREMKRFNNSQANTAMEAGAHYLNLDEVVPKTLEVFYDDCHFTDAGNIKVANAVLPAVVQCLLAR